MSLERQYHHVKVEHDGFAGDIIGHYTTREGKHGYVVQQDGTKVVHVYSVKWFAGQALPAFFAHAVECISAAMSACRKATTGNPRAVVDTTPTSAPPDWQPIETAPRDGTKIDLWARRVETDKYERFVDCSWQPGLACPGDTEEFWIGLAVSSYRNGDNPTHWMQQPPAPQAGGAK